MRYARASVSLVRGFAKELGDKKWHVWCESPVIGIFVRELAHLRKLSSGARGAVRYLVRFARWANLSTDSDVVRIVCACDFGFQMSARFATFSDFVVLNAILRDGNSLHSRIARQSARTYFVT